MRGPEYTSVNPNGRVPALIGNPPKTSGGSVSKLWREYGMINASFYKWRAKSGGMDASMITELKAMADENRRLKRLYAEMSIY